MGKNGKSAILSHNMFARSRIVCLKCFLALLPSGSPFYTHKRRFARRADHIYIELSIMPTDQKSKIVAKSKDSDGPSEPA